MPCTVKINNNVVELFRKVDKPQVIEGIIKNQSELLSFSLLACEILERSDKAFDKEIAAKLRETINQVLGKE